MFAIAAWKVRRLSESEGKAARSMVRRAGELEMLPRRVMRRPAWSVKLVSDGKTGGDGGVNLG